MRAVDRAGRPHRGERLLRHLRGSRRIAADAPLAGEPHRDIHRRRRRDAHRVDQHIVGGRSRHSAAVHVACRLIVLGVAGVHGGGRVHADVTGDAAGGLTRLPEAPGVAGRLGGARHLHVHGRRDTLRAILAQHQAPACRRADGVAGRLHDHVRQQHVPAARPGRRAEGERCAARPVGAAGHRPQRDRASRWRRCRRRRRRRRRRAQFLLLP